MLITREWVTLQNDVRIMWKIYFSLTKETKETGGRKLHELKLHDWYPWPSILGR
jgi:hypothetical protein